MNKKYFDTMDVTQPQFWYVNHAVEGEPEDKKFRGLVTVDGHVLEVTYAATLEDCKADLMGLLADQLLDKNNWLEVWKRSVMAQVEEN